ncbi:MAG TPA: hypothetical protein VGR79_01705 [Stellaceae bacterium]|nr:hypothetical protein [Stellaceae bacterium]
MPDSKIQFALGALSFSGEGEQGWLADQLDKILHAAPSLGRATVASPVETANEQSDPAQSSTSFTQTLASYIKEKNAESNQTQRFLAAANWLRRRGAQKLTTAMVSKALADNQQKRLGNPADCLNQNVSKGFCEKTDGGFYITPDGLKALGEQ